METPVAVKQTFRNVLVRDQVLTVYHWMGVTPAQIPRKGAKLLLCDPNQRLQVTVTRMEAHRSTYDKPLYLCEHSNY